MSGDPDVVVVGSGPNGLAAAVTLSAAGLRVLVIEGGPTIGGGCRTEELTLPGFRHDVCSAAHPLAVASSFFRRFDLAARGVRFAGSDVVFAQPLDGGRAAVVSRSVDATAERLGRDAAAYRRLLGPLARDCGPVTDLLLSPIRRPPAHLNAGLAVFGMNGLRSAAGVARRFHTAEARALFAGAAAHGMMPLTRPPTGAVGLMLTGLAHAVGWPVAEGGSARITDALADAVVAAGGAIETGRWVRSLAELPRPGRSCSTSRRGRCCRSPVTGCRPVTATPSGGSGTAPGCARSTSPCPARCPGRTGRAAGPGRCTSAGRTTRSRRPRLEVAAGQHPDAPYVLVTQPGVADPTRAPAGCHTLWTYCHVPAGSTVDMTARIEAQIERFAPGFRDLILARHTVTAADEETRNPNYVGGDIAAGMQDIRQTVFRPALRWNPYRIPVPGLYLCSSSTPPLPGVHGRCGELAALTALGDVFGIRRPPELGPSGSRPAAALRGAR